MKAPLAILLVVSVLWLGGCALMKPLQGGATTTTLGGTAAPTVVKNRAPENPSTPSTTTVEKTTTREYAAPNTSEGQPAPTAPSVKENSVPDRKDASTSVAPVPSVILRETVHEVATTQTGAAQKDTARDLTARLANMRGVMWAGVLLLIGGPLIGWKLGWFTNGCIAGAVGLLLIILSTVIPGNEAWFGLGGLLVIPLIGFAYYKAHHDAAHPKP